MACPQGLVFERTVVVTTRRDGRDALATAIDEEARRQCLENDGEAYCRPTHIQVLEYSEGIQNIEGVVLWAFYAKVLVNCGRTRRRWWEILWDATWKTAAIVVASVILVYGGVAIAAELLRRPDKAGEVLQFARVLAKKMAA
jgi:hypothetical protein